MALRTNINIGNHFTNWHPIVVNPDLAVLPDADPCAVPFVYHTPSGLIYWTVSEETADGDRSREALLSAIGVARGPEWVGGAFTFQPDSQQLIFEPCVGAWSGYLNSVHYPNVPGSDRVGLFPWFQLRPAMEAAMRATEIPFGPNPRPQGSARSVADSFQASHSAQLSRLSANGLHALFRYYEMVARNPPPATIESPAIFSLLSAHFPR